MSKSDIEKSADLVEADEELSDEITLSSGVVVKGVVTSPLTFMRVMSRYQRPQPPVTYSEELARNIENTDHPDYLDRLEKYEQDFSTLLLNTMIIRGLEIVSLPKGMKGHKSDGWMDTLIALDMPVRKDSDPWRFLAWMNEVAIKTAEDIETISEVVGRLNGIREGDVQSAAGFPGRN